MDKFRLYILGSAELRKADGELDHSFLAGAKRLALLTYLVLNHSRGFIRRDHLLPLLWPEKNQKNARNSLSNMLYHIRKSLGSSVLEVRGSEELKLNPELVWCDVFMFQDLIKKENPEEATELYRGDLLDGFHIPDASQQFEQWLDMERESLRTAYLDCLEALAVKAEKDERIKDAISWRKKRTLKDPLDTKQVKKLMQLMARTETRDEAMQIAKKHAALMENELDLDADNIFRELTSDLKNTGRSPDGDISNSNNELKSVAVLPFEELGNDQETSGFANGLHNDLLTRLSGISALNVISRTSVLQYRKSDKPIPQIAGELGAGTIVEGSVQFSSGRVRLNIQLIDVKNDNHIWAETYDRVLTASHLFDIQCELALKITESLKAKLKPAEKKRIIEWAPTEDLEAYRLYIYGRKHLDQRTKTGMSRAEEYFSRAVEQDPKHALAWTGLADTLTLQYGYGHKSKKDALPPAEDAINRALELDSNLAESYASLGLFYISLYKGSAAIHELKRAVELQPSYAEAHNWLSWNYQILGMPVEALNSAEKAVKLNPLSPEAVSNLSFSHLQNGNIEMSLHETLRGKEIHPEWKTIDFYHALALFYLKRYEEAISILTDLSVPWAGNGPLATLALCHIKSGNKAESEKIQSDLKQMKDLFSTALIQAALGEKDRSLELFMEVRHWGDWEAISIHQLYPEILGPLKKDPRFLQVLKNAHQSRGAEQKKIKHSTKVDKKAVAVLSFTDYMEKSELSPFSEGIQNDLITKLSKINDLTIISADSVRRLSFEEISFEEIALKLGVGTVIKGGVQHIVGRIRLTIQLIDVTTEQIRWAETYDRELTAENLFNIQSELAEKITGSLRAELTSTEKILVGEQPTENLDAYLLYVQGRSYLSQRTEQSIFKSLNLFRDAVKQDPEYANAWAGLAEALLLIKWYSYSTNDELRDPMEAIQKALELNPELGEAYCSLGIYYSYHQNGPDAIKALEKCIKLQPGYSEAYNWLGWLKMIMGDPAGGLEPAEHAARLDPLSPYTRVFLAVVYLASNKYREALEESISARKIRPEYGLSHFVEGLSLYHLEKYPEAEFALQESLKLEGSNGSPIKNEAYATLALAKAANGNHQEARNLLEKIKDKRDYFCTGLVEAALNNYEEAHNLFEKVEKFGAFTTPMCRYYFPDVLEPVRNNSRFNALIKKINKSWKM